MEVISMGSGDSVNGMPYEGPVTAGKVYVCSRCSHRWVARKKGGLPKNCHKCRSTVWMKDYHICKCYRCNHKWGTVNEEPKRCPKCHSTKWAVPVKTGESSPRVRSVSRSMIGPDLMKEVVRRYAEGESCTAIAIATGISFSDVYAIVKSHYAGDHILV